MLQIMFFILKRKEDRKEEKVAGRELLVRKSMGILWKKEIW